MMSWRNCHLLVGGLGLVLFMLQGQYMARIIGVADLPDAAALLLLDEGYRRIRSRAPR